MITDSLNIIDIKGVAVYSSVYYPEIEPTDDDDYIISVDGDRLDNLAHEFYSNVDFWWMIAVANNLRKDTLYIEPGLQIRIPKDTDIIQANFDTLNNINVNI